MKQVMLLPFWLTPYASVPITIGVHLVCLLLAGLLYHFITLLSLSIVKAPDKWNVWKKAFWKSFLLGILAKTICTMPIWLQHLPDFFKDYDYAFEHYFHSVFDYMPFWDTTSTVTVALCFLAGSALIFLAEFFVAFRGTELNRRQRMWASLIFMLATAPYILFVPFFVMYWWVPVAN